ncbi:outer envelope protein [Actimicrobium antarcticum]|uniref:Outer envelope protein n=1 Tax=Actimicrobium antarcticum TaxID=1051899 RepID=A0ABP7SMK5_9BURK
MSCIKKSPAFTFSLVAALLAGGTAAHAAEWSDTSLGYRYGTKFAEPFNPNDISKNIFSLTHASGYKYGTNFLNVDALLSDSKDPTRVNSGTTSGGAQEIYVVYRNTLDIGKVSGSPISFGPVRGVGITGGFDVNTKNDAGYGSKKRMLVLGPTLMLDVPGFLNVSALLLKESNQPYGINSRYTYKLHPMLSAAWGIPLAMISAVPTSFEGYANFIAAKGDNEFGGRTSPETNVDMQVMFDVGSLAGMGKNTFRLGVEYQYWKNKFGNPSTVTGSKASTPMVRAEYHF